jgi:hypothetical protein
VEFVEDDISFDLLRILGSRGVGILILCDGVMTRAGVMFGWAAAALTAEILSSNAGILSLKKEG